MKQTIFKGSGVAIITPMLEDGSVNYPVLKELLEQQIAGGTDAIVICGTTGEASALNDTEHLDVIEFACATVNRRLAVLAGPRGIRATPSPSPARQKTVAQTLCCR